VARLAAGAQAGKATPPSSQALLAAARLEVKGLRLEA
jgi:hypothetical protein